jgi:hypothetical protein
LAPSTARVRLGDTTPDSGASTHVEAACQRLPELNLVIDAPDDQLNRARIDAGLSLDELWLRYFELGGMNTPVELEAHLYGALTASGHNHDLIAHALNERFVELGRNHPVPYSAISRSEASDVHRPSRAT